MKRLSERILQCALICAVFLLSCAEEEELPPPPEVDRRPTDVVAPFPAEYPADELREWNDRVYYQIFVRSFYDSDGDGIGDLRGIIEKLDYLNDGDPTSTEDLGIRGIWLMPINESPSYHGYDVTDYYSIDSEYGSLADFRELLAEAEKRGISVITDLVLNHTSSDHPWFLAARQNDAQYRNYYVWEDENPGTLGPWGQQVWHNAGDNEYYYGVFWGGMPDLNYWNPAVDTEVRDIVRFWLENVGVQGFRLDAIMYLKEEADLLKNTFSNHEWFQIFYEYYKGINPAAFTIGEAWTETEEAVKYIGNEVDAVFEFDLASAILNTVRQGSNTSLMDQQEDVLALYPEGQYGRFLANHDQTRSATILNGDLEKQKTAAAILLTGPGIPFIYYGEEVGVEGNKPDEHLRRPMHWLPTGGFSTADPWQDYADKLETHNVETMAADPASVLNRYRTLIQLRNDSPALRRGSLIHVPATPRRIYAFFRHSPEETLLVIHNLGSERSDYGLFMETTPFTGIRLEPLYLGNTTGNFTADAAAAQLELTRPELNEAGGFENYKPLPLLEEYATYVFRVVGE